MDFRALHGTRTQRRKRKLKERRARIQKKHRLQRAAKKQAHWLLLREWWKQATGLSLQESTRRYPQLNRYLMEPGRWEKLSIPMKNSKRFALTCLLNASGADADATLRLLELTSPMGHLTYRDGIREVMEPTWKRKTGFDLRRRKWVNLG